MFSSLKSQPSRRPNRFLPRLEELENRALPSTYVSTNWSGYGVQTNFNSPANYAVSAVLGSWVVPTVTGTNHAYSSSWVGIDGFSSSTVEQIGTEQDTAYTSAVDGTPQYYAWYEMYPAYPVMISMTIKPGDLITASVVYSGPATDSSGTFTLSLADNSTGKSFTLPGQSVTSAQRSSAEWIQEAPSSWYGVLPLANFGTETFSKASATVSGAKGVMSAFPNASIDMINRFGQTLDTTSALNSTGDGFTVTFTGTSSGGGGRHHRGSTATIVAAVTTIAPQNPAPASLPAATVYSVARPQDQAFFAPSVVQAPQPTAFPGFLIVAPGATEATADAPKNENQQGDGAANHKATSAVTSRLIDVPGGTMSRQALDEVFADPANHQRTSGEELPTLVTSTAPVIDVTAGAELSALLLGAYLGNPIKAKETEDNTKRKVKWL